MRWKYLSPLMVSVFVVAKLGAAGADLRLLEAAKNADAAAARALLKQGLDVNARAGDGATALHWAAYRNDLATAELLISARASVNAVNDLGVTPLWVATTTRSTAVAAALLKAGADPNIAPPTGGTPLMLASRTGDVEAVKLLVAHGANPNVAEDAGNQTALMWASAGRSPEIVQALIEAGADLKARTAVSKRHVLLCCAEYNGDARGGAVIDWGGFTPLLFAAREGLAESARLLLKAGADVNVKAADGTSALALAAMSGQTEVAEVLIEHGADLNAADSGYAPLHAAVLRADQPLLKTLIAKGANLNVRLTKGTWSRRAHNDYAFDKFTVGATPFALSAREGEAEMMRALAAAGADMTMPLNDGRMALHLAAEGEQRARRGGTFSVNADTKINREPEQRALAALTVLLELGADVNAAGRGGQTAMHVAALRRFNSVIEFLVQKGAMLEAKDAAGATALVLALTPTPPPPGTTVLTQGYLLEDEGPKTAALLRQLGAQE